MPDLLSEDPLFFLSDAELMAFARQAAQQALAQVGQPLSVSIAGRNISYGSAAEAMNVIESAMRLRQKQLEVRTAEAALVPFAVTSVVRG